MSNKSAFCLKTHEGLTHQFDFVIQQWRKDIGPSTHVILGKQSIFLKTANRETLSTLKTFKGICSNFSVLFFAVFDIWPPVTTNECLKYLGIRDATCIVHYGFPTSPRVFGSRLFCMARNFRNLSARVRMNEQDDFGGQNVLCTNDQYINITTFSESMCPWRCSGRFLLFLFWGFLSGSNRELPSCHQVGAADLGEERSSCSWSSALPGKNQRPAPYWAAVLRPGCPCGPRRPEDWQASVQLPEELRSLQVSFLDLQMMMLSAVLYFQEIWLVVSIGMSL